MFTPTDQAARDLKALLREIERDRMIARNDRDDARDQYLADHGLSRSYTAEDMADYHHDMGGE